MPTAALAAIGEMSLVACYLWVVNLVFVTH